MKKRRVKSVLASLAVVLALTGAFYASADTTPPPEGIGTQADVSTTGGPTIGHTHTPAENWESGENGHWKNCTGCGELLKSEEHTPDADGTCSICGYETKEEVTPPKHDHNDWAEEWSSDASGHWHACTVKDCTKQKDFASHDTKGQGGACSVCGYKKAGGTTIGGTNKPDTGIIEPDLTKDITSGTLVNDIKAEPEGSKIKINYDSSHSTLVSDVFSAIQGKDKSIFLFDGFVQWRFDGQKIKNPKQIDLKVEIASLKNMTGSNKKWISDLVGNTSTTVLSFADNGELPGAAMISVHINDIFPNTKQTSFWIYYFNPTSHELDLIAKNRAIDENGYLSFMISHNSDYVITEKAIHNSSDTTSSSRPSSSSGSSYKGPFGGSSSSTTPSSNKDNPHTGA